VSTWIDKEGRRHVGIMVRGKRVHRILPEGASAGDAKQLEADLRAAIGVGRAPVIPGDPPMTAIMALYVEHAQTLRSPKTAAYHAGRVGPWAEKYRASQARECAAHVLRDMRAHYAAATINRSLGALKKALALAWDRGLTPENYGLRIKRLPEHNQRDMALSMVEVRQLAEHASASVQAAIWIALFTGCRRGEILALRKEDIGADTITIRAGNTKTLKTRVVPIAPPLRHHLPAIPLGINFEGLKTGFRRAREAAGMPWVTFHDLRRSCGTLMIQAGVDLYVVSKLLGHSTVAVTQARYAHLQVDQLRAGLEATFTAEITPPIAQAGKQKRPRRAAAA
jgi:integrase